MNYIDAVLHLCEVNEIEVESVPKLISKPLKEKLKYEAQVKLHKENVPSKINASVMSEFFQSELVRGDIQEMTTLQEFCFRCAMNLSLLKSKKKKLNILSFFRKTD